MVHIAGWMRALTARMQEEFGERLLFLGLQGSYRRGEATEESDIDVVVVLDALALCDLKRYRALLSEMPEGEKACGFVSGKRELLAWPRHELFQFQQDTRAYFGDLNALLPAFSEDDIRQSARINAGNLYNALCHSFVRGEDVHSLYGAYKSAFFLLQLLSVLSGMPYASTKAELSTLLEGGDLKVLDVCMHWEALGSDRAARPDFYCELLLNWCADTLKKL